jgi:aminoglycoside phosphotransferase family enzyme/predicted kinase
MPRETLPAYVQALKRAGAYPSAPGSVELVQTHISYVFLAGDEVFKLKKPIDLGFANFTTLERRREACEAEVRLNRRGCPGNIYIGVETVTRAGNRYRIGGEGEVVDYAVHMKRLPADRMMDRLLERGAVDVGLIGRVAARLTELHEQADRGPHVTAVGGPETHLRDWRDSLVDMERYAGRTLSRKRFETIRDYAEGTIARESGFMQQREDEGWVRDCHGDLRSDAVCFDESVPGGICIYDCIEFNERFRYIDTALDAAFLGMDLDYRGHPDLSDLFIGLYAAAIGDKTLPLLLHFYKSFRAVVRGKVESYLLDDPGVPAKQKTAARRRARAYFELAEGYARRRPFRGAVLVTGPSGTGKSVVAGALAARLGAALLSTDVVRMELFGKREGARDALGEGRYTPESREQVYDAMLSQAGAFLAQGRPVVLDGTYITKVRRAPVVATVRAAKAPLLVIECSAPDAVVRHRQEQRQAESWTASEGRYDVYQQQKRETEPADEVSERERLALDTTQELGSMLTLITDKLGMSQVHL